jgi:hypothetical protein
METKMPKRKFNFKEALRAMLVRIGAQPSERYYDMVLETQAGPLWLAAYDDWLAARFESPEKAARVVTCGSLNRFSGKWNWHYTKPGQDEVDFLEGLLVKLLPTAKVDEAELVLQNDV